MEPFNGNEVKYSVGVEGIRNGGVVADLKVPFSQLDGDLQTKYPKEIKKGNKGSRLESAGQFSKIPFSDGKLGGDVEVNSFAIFLYNIFGEKTSVETGASTGVFEHDLVISENNTTPTLVIGKETPVAKTLFTLINCQTFEISATIDDTVKVALTIHGNEGVAEPLISVEYTKEDFAILSRKGIFKIASTYLQLDGANDICLTSFKLVFNTNSSLKYCLKGIGGVLNGRLSINGTIEIDYKNDIFTGYAAGSDYYAIQFGMFDTDTDLGDGSNPTVDFRFYRVGFMDAIIAEPIDGTVTQSINFVVFKDIGNNAIGTCKIINTLDF